MPPRIRIRTSAAVKLTWRAMLSRRAGAVVVLRVERLSQQPGAGEAPGIEVTALVFIGAIIAGLVRSIETVSLHAAEFGVGITAEGSEVWLMLVLPMSGSGD